MAIAYENALEALGLALFQLLKETPLTTREEVKY